MGARRLFGMRVWLSLVFVAMCAATAGATANLFLGRFERDVRERARELAAGYAVEAAIRVAEAEGSGRDVAEVVEDGSRAPTFVFAAERRLLTSARAQGAAFAEVPQGERALAEALAGRRFVGDVEEGAVVGLPLATDEASAIVVYARHPDLSAGLGVARRTVLEAAFAAIVLGALVGILAAWLLAARLRRIAASAAAIEAGDFEHRLARGFPDEVGALAASVDRMRERLRASFETLGSERDRLRRILERLEEGVLTVDRDLRVGFANRAARRLLGDGLTEGEPLPEPWAAASLRAFAGELFADDVAAAAHAVVEDGERTYAVAGIPPEGLDTAVLVVVDTSERERRERAEREFVANAAHELRTPLQTILGAIEALRAGAKDDPEDEERFLTHIERETGRLARLTRSLLVLARAQTGEEAPVVGPVDVRAVIDDVVAALDAERRADVEIDCPARLAVLADRDLLHQALLNVAGNAAKHADGRMAITAAADGNGAVRVDVADTGPGIPPAERERVFDRFYRANGGAGEGFGLGLAIARESVEAIGGTIAILSAPGGGTTTRITLRPATGGDA